MAHFQPLFDNAFPRRSWRTGKRIRRAQKPGSAGVRFLPPPGGQPKLHALFDHGAQPKPGTADENLEQASLHERKAFSAMGLREDPDAAQRFYMQGWPIHSPCRKANSHAQRQSYRRAIYEQLSRRSMTDLMKRLG